MNVNVTQDKRQPWHLIAKIDGGNVIVDHRAFNDLMRKIHSRQTVRREARRVKRVLVTA